jgi:MFS family permease
VVVVSLLVINTTFYGVDFSFGVFFKSIESEFNLTRTATSGIFSIFMMLGIVFAIIGGWALDRYGPRIVIFLMGIFTGFGLLLTSQTNSSWQLFITYSLLLSIGTGATYVVIMSTVSRWFNKKRGLALGIAGSGGGLGRVIVAPFATYLISHFDWRIAYIVIGLIAWLIVLPISRLLKKDPCEIGVLPDGINSQKENNTDEKEGIQPVNITATYLLRNRSFWFFISLWLFWSSSFYLVLTHLVPHITDMGFSAGEAATVISLMGGMSIAGSVLVGRISDSIGRKTTAIICSLLLAGTMIWLTWVQELWMLFMFAVIYGFNSGGLTPAVNALIGDIFGLKSIGIIMGVLHIGWAVGAAIGPAIGGFIFDISNSYSLAFWMGAGAWLVITSHIALIRGKTNDTAKILNA